MSLPRLSAGHRARKIYNGTPEKERAAKKQELAKILSVSDRLVRSWLSRIDKDTKAKRNKRIFAAWMACYTQEEIAEKEGFERTTVTKIVEEYVNFGNFFTKSSPPPDRIRATSL